MRLQIIEPDETKGQLREIFKKLAMVPNVLCMMANSEPVLENYTHFHYTQPSYKLSEKFRKMVSLAVSEYNECSYCIALHTSTAIASGILT
jgi:AhpD family alkylhydroperoxidase